MPKSSVSKATKTKRTAAKTSIPPKDRKHTTYVRRFMSLANGKPVTDQEAYRSVLDQRKFTAARLAKERAEKEAAEKTRERDTREQAVQALTNGIIHLADVRDFLEEIQAEKLSQFSTEALVNFARAALVESATGMEQALYDLGLFTETNGFFADKPMIPAAEAAAEAKGAA